MNILDRALDAIVDNIKRDARLTKALDNAAYFLIAVLLLTMVSGNTGVYAIGFGLVYVIDSLRFLTVHNRDNYFMRVAFWSAIVLIGAGIGIVIALTITGVNMNHVRVLYMFLTILTVSLYFKGLWDDRPKT